MKNCCYLIFSGDKKRQSVIFILDEFDQFTHHHNQHLLYNLFDMCQSKTTPIGVIGLTTRQDVVELMEKRVKSRFSHRQYQLHGPKDFEQYVGVVKSILAPEDKVDAAWRDHINDIFSDTGKNKVLTYLERIYNYNKSIRIVKNILYCVVSRLQHHQSDNIDIEYFENKLVEVFKDTKAVLVKGMSRLELCLLISAARLSAKHANQPFNLEMILHEYEEFVTFEGSKMFRIPNKDIAVSAMEKLLASHLVRPLSSRQAKVQKCFRQMYLNVDLVDLTTIIASSNVPATIQKWAQATLQF